MMDKWRLNAIQFPRLLAEMAATVNISVEDLRALCASMDIEEGDLNDLIDRAQQEWEYIKGNETRTAASGYTHVKDIELEDGEALEVWRHPGGGLFAVDASYMDQVDCEVYEPFGGDKVRLLMDEDKAEDTHKSTS